MDRLMSIVSDIFIGVLNMSLISSLVIVAVIVLRLLLRRAPRVMSCLLWAVAGMRLMIPISLECILSLIPSAEPIKADIAVSPAPQINSGIAAVDRVVNPAISSLTPDAAGSVNPLQIIIPIAAAVWLIGIAAMLTYALMSYLRVSRRVAMSIPGDEHDTRVQLCDGISSPFILGIFKPRIYLPSDIGAEERELVLSHERAHLSRLDHVWKPLAYFVLTVHWFDPLCWLGYILFCRDIEAACDEKVIKRLDRDGKCRYSQALLDAGTKRHIPAVCPLAFGETDVKARVRNVLNYKKPAFWVIVVAALLCVVVAVCLLTDPMHVKNDDSGIGSISSGSEHEGFTITVKSADTWEIHCELVNKSNELLIFDPNPVVSADGKTVKPQKEVAEQPSFMVVSDAKGKTDITIDISGYELDPEKLYRFEFTLTPSGDSEKHYTAYIDLKICMVYPFSDNELVLDRLIYDDGRFSSILLPTRDGERIRFLVSGGMLYTTEIGDGAYTCAGELTQVSLSEYDPTDMLFDLVWADGNTPVRLKKSTVRAFRCINEAKDRTYFLLEQENGDIFVTIGYDPSSCLIRSIYTTKSNGKVILG